MYRNFLIVLLVWILCMIIDWFVVFVCCVCWVMCVYFFVGCVVWYVGLLFCFDF